MMHKTLHYILPVCFVPRGRCFVFRRDADMHSAF